MTSRPVLRALWADFPLLNFPLYSVAIAHAEISNLEPQRLDLLPTLVFPLVVLGTVYGLRFRTASLESRVTSAVVVLGAIATLCLSYFTGSRAVIDAGQLRAIYEVSVIAQTVLLVLHAASFGYRMVLWLVGPVVVYGVLLENGGIMLGYFEQLSYHLYVGPFPAPLATMVAWVGVIYLVVWVTWELRKHLPSVARSATLSAAIAACTGLLLDLQIDPLATAVGFWRWHPLLEGGMWGVPWLNFVAWWWALFALTWAVFRRENEYGLEMGAIGDPLHRRWLWARLPMVIGAAALLFSLTMVIIEGGLSGPTFRILHLAAVRYGIVDPSQVWSPGS